VADVMLATDHLHGSTPMLQKEQASSSPGPKSGRHEEADRDDAVLVAVTRDGRFYLNQDRVNITLQRKSMTCWQPGWKDGFVKSDFRASTVMLSGCRWNSQRRVDRIGLLTERLDDQVRR
jgi:hypothetical protein